jgi:hypothetical protein
MKLDPNIYKLASEQNVFIDKQSWLLYQAMILVKHPFLLNLLICHTTFEEYIKYRDKLLDALVKIFGDIPVVLLLKRILASELKLENKSAI